MDQRIEKVMTDYENYRMGLDDKFSFKCRECGKCCKNRDDILLTARDLYNIAKYLGRTIDEIIHRYCEIYIGDSSRIPIVRLKPSGPENACPLLRYKHCIVHNAKPTVCALFPLGRAVTMPQNGAGIEITEDIQPQYFMHPATCGSQSSIYTVRNWLEMFRIPIEDEFYSLWTSAIIFISNYFIVLEEQKVPDCAVECLWSVAFSMLYLNFDTNVDFINQFNDNISKLKAVLIIAKDKTETQERGIPDGE